MKAKYLILAALAFVLALAACTPKGGWTPEELQIISSPAPLRVLTIYDRADNIVLRSPSTDLSASEIRSAEFEKLAEAMLVTVTDSSQAGVGIAAPQVGLLRRVIAVQRFDKAGEPFEVYANARVIATRGEMAPGPEGCLSIPGLRADVLRYRDIDIQYTSRATLKDTTERIQGFTAVIFQHECDHLDGTLYIDKLIPGTLRID